MREERKDNRKTGKKRCEARSNDNIGKGENDEVTDAGYESPLKRVRRDNVLG